MTERTTRQRTTIEACLARLPDFHTAQEVHDHLRREGHAVSLPTVYRTLGRLADADQLDQIKLPNGETAYRRCSTSHHHHLICRQCHAVVEIAAEGVERWATEVAAQHGFTDLAHHVELSGLCANCA
jgi:Fur family ferric uptake transcriptional regulator